MIRRRTKDCLSQPVIGSASPISSIAALAAKYEPTPILFRVNSILGHSLGIPTAEFSVQKIPPLLSIHALHFNTSQL